MYTITSSIPTEVFNIVALLAFFFILSLVFFLLFYSFSVRCCVTVAVIIVVDVVGFFKGLVASPLLFIHLVCASVWSFSIRQLTPYAFYPCFSVNTSRCEHICACLCHSTVKKWSSVDCCRSFSISHSHIDTAQDQLTRFCSAYFR